MSAVYKHALEQGPSVAAIARVALSSLRVSRGAAEAPGPWHEATLEPRSPELIRDYVLECGGDPAQWGTELPPHLFSQWAFALSSRALEALPYALTRVLNAGCAWTKRAPLPATERLRVRARLEKIDDDGKRLKAAVKVVTGTDRAPDALEAELRVFLPLVKRSGPKSEEPLVPPEAQQLARQYVAPDAGLSFALLTGDFNPIHWLTPAARLAGFPGCILHGFAIHARAIEALGASLPGGVRSVKHADIKLLRPLGVGRHVGVYRQDKRFFMGAGVGGTVYLSGTFEEENT